MADGVLQFNVTSLVEEVLQKHGKRLCDIDLTSRKSQQALRRYDAAEWLRKMVGVVAAKDLPAEPSEEHFRLGLRSGIILCNAVNKIQPAAIPKVVEVPSDTPDGANQYTENVRSFLMAIEEMGIPTFEVSDLEKGGKSSRIVNCILALKVYYEWKQCGGNSKPPLAMNQIVRKKSLDSSSSEENLCGDFVHNISEVIASDSLSVLVHQLISDKNGEDIPMIVENMLSKLMEELEQRLASMRTSIEDNDVSASVEAMAVEYVKRPIEMKDDESYSDNEGESEIIRDESCSEKGFDSGASEDDSLKSDKYIEQGSSKETSLKKNEGKYKKELALKRQVINVEHQQRSLKELKNIYHSTKQDFHRLQMQCEQEVCVLGEHLKGLAQAATGYQKVLVENRKLYNHVQELKERLSSTEPGSGDVKELKEQIVALKAALARKDGGSSPDPERVRSSGSSPSHSSWNSKTEVQSGSSSRRHSLDSQDLIVGSPSWPTSPALTEEEEKSDCVNKVIKAAQAAGKRRHSLDNGLARRRNNIIDHNDDLDATSDSSDLDYQSPILIPKSNSMPNVVGSKLKRPTPTPRTTTKTQETTTRSQIPQPTRRLSNGTQSPLHKNGPTQPASSATNRRRTPTGK